MTSAQPLKINLLLNHANRSWIIQKIAERLAQELAHLNATARITEAVDGDADLVHHMSWAFANMNTRQPSTMFITHLDDPYKIHQVRTTLTRNVQVGICMSRDMMGLLQKHGCPPASLYFINPAHDGLVAPRRIAIGITSRVYPDGRKREALLNELARQMDLSAFVFRIFGMGWEPTIAALRSAGAEVEYFPESSDYRSDYEAIMAAIPYFDYYLYLGLDEGSLGTLDALAAGVPTIVTPQGFHLDLPQGITHPIVSAEDLRQVFTQLTATREERRAGVRELTWEKYARRHHALWASMIEGRAFPPLPVPSVNSAAFSQHIDLDALRARNYKAGALDPRRLLSALSRSACLRFLRRAVDRLRLKK